MIVHLVSSKCHFFCIWRFVEMDREALGILLFLAARAGREKRRLGVEDSEGSQGHDLPSRSSQADHPVLQLGFHWSTESRRKSHPQPGSLESLQLDLPASFLRVGWRLPLGGPRLLSQHIRKREKTLHGSRCPDVGRQFSKGSRENEFYP